MVDINEIVVQLRALGFENFVQDTNRSIRNVEVLAKAINASGESSAAGLRKWAKAAFESGDITKTFAKQLRTAVNAFEEQKRALTGKDKLQFNFAIKALVSEGQIRKELQSKLEKLSGHLEIKADTAKFEKQFQHVIDKFKQELAIASRENPFDFKVKKAFGPVDQLGLIDPNKRANAIKSILPALEEEFKRQNAILDLEGNSIKALKEKEHLARQYVILLDAMKSSSFIGPPGSSTKDLGRHPGLTDFNASTINKSIAVQETYAKNLEKTSKAKVENLEKTKVLQDSEEKLNKSIGLAIGKLIRYRVAFYAMRTAIESVTGSIKNFAELQLQFADLRKIIDPAVDSMVKFTSAAFDMAQRFGVTTKEVVESFRIWAQAGLKQNEVLKATEATLIGVNSIGLDAIGVTEALTAAIFTYGESIENLIKIESKWLAVEKEFPVSAADLANSIKVVGSAARTVGVDLDDLAGFVVAIGSATRKSGTAVGQSIKTMFAELPKKETIEAFESIGIAVLKTATDFRDFDDILDDLNNKWKNLTSVQKANLSITLSGVRRYSDFIALMDNYSLKLAATIKSQRASNEAQKASDIILNTLSKNWSSLKASVEEFSFALGKSFSGGLNSLIQLGKAFLDFANAHPILVKLTGAFVTFGSLLSVSLLTIFAVAFAISGLRTKIRDLALETERTSIRGKEFAFIMHIMGGSAKTASGATGVFGLVNAVGKLNAVLAIAGLALSVFSSLILATGSKSRNSFKDLSSSIEDLDHQITGLKDTINSLGTSQKFFAVISRDVEQLAKSILTTDKTSSDYGKQVSKLSQLLEVAGASSVELFNASQDVKKGLDENRLSLESFNTAVTNHISLLDQEIAKTKELTELRKTELSAFLTKRIVEFESKISDLNTRLVDTKRLFGDIGSKLKVTFDENIFKSALESVDALKQDFVDRLSTGDFLQGSKVADGIFGSIKEEIIANKNNSKKILSILFAQFEAAGKTSDKARLISGSFVNHILKALEKDAKQRAKDINQSVESFFPSELQATFKINLEQGQNVIEPVIDDMKRDINIALLEFSNGTVDASQALTRINGIIIDGQESLNGLLDVYNQSTKALGIYGTELDKARGQFNSLNEVTNKSGAQLFVGQKAQDTVSEWNKKVRELVHSYTDLTRRISVSQQTAKFGDILPGFDQMAFDNAAEFLTKLSEESKNLKQEIDNLTKDRSDLSRFLAIYDKDGSKASETIGNLVTNLKEWDNTIIGTKLKAGADTIGNVHEELIKVEATLEGLNEVSRKLQLLPEIEASQRAIEQFNQKSREIYKSIGLVSNSFEVLSAELESQIRLLSVYNNKEVELAELEAKRTDILNEQNTLLAKLNIGREDRIKSILDSITSNFDDAVESIRKIKDAKLDKLSKQLIANATLFQDTISNAIGNIPDNILAGHEKRRDLQNDIVQAEFDLQEARKDGDSAAMAAAQQRLGILSKELKNYRRGWFEIRNLVLDIFGSISSAFWKNLSDEIGKSLASLSLNGKPLGDIVAEKMAIATTNLTQSWAATARQVNDEFLKKFRQITEDMNLNLANVREASSKTPQDIVKLTPGEIKQFTPTSLEILIDSLKGYKSIIENTRDLAKKTNESFAGFDLSLSQGDNSKIENILKKFPDEIASASAKFQIDPRMIAAIIAQESGGNPNAVNARSGATGLMQLMS
ncbi:MAG: phage tail tape measure protein, partial [Nanoarchaeota archaeon]